MEAERSRGCEGLEVGRALTNLRGVAGVARVLSVLLEIFDVNRWQAAHQELQLVTGEDCDEVWRHQLVEALLEGIDLFPDRSREVLFSNKLHVLVFVLVCHWDVAPVWLQINRKHFSELATDNGEGLIQNAFNRILRSPKKSTSQGEASVRAQVLEFAGEIRLEQGGAT